MSELKADNTFVFGEECLAYKKSEADKVIADLKQKIKQQDVLLGKALNTISESHKHVVSLARKCNHANFKRCLAWAERYEVEYKLARYLAYNSNKEIKAYKRWQKWLELAEKFKEAK